MKKADGEQKEISFSEARSNGSNLQRFNRSRLDDERCGRSRLSLFVTPFGEVESGEEYVDGADFIKQFYRLKT